MKHIGQLLKEKREQLNVSLEEISMATKISIKHLQALEEGNESKLPAKTFIRGFVQSYAKYLGLDINEVMEKFHEEMGPTNAQTNIPVPERTDLEKDVVGRGARILTGVAIVVIIVIIIVAERIISKRELAIKEAEVQAITGSDKPVEIPTPTPVEPEATPGEASSPTPTAAPAAAVADVSPTPTPTPEPTPKKPEATPTPKPSPAATPSPTPTPEKTGPQEVIIEALDQVTVVVTIDNKAPQEVKMNADQILTFKAKSKMQVFTPNGGAISIINNGFEIGVPGNLGQPKTMVFPQ